MGKVCTGVGDLTGRDLIVDTTFRQTSEGRLPQASN